MVRAGCRRGGVGAGRRARRNDSPARRRDQRLCRARLRAIAAFGGLPLDYRTDPPTVNFTGAQTVEAIRQVLDLAVQGYISYSQQATFAVTVGVGDSAPAITTSSMNQFRLPVPPGQSGTAQSTTALTTYPQGSQYNAVAYEITAGYISATAQNPEAAYRFLSEVARTPQLFSGMPARASLVADPAVIAAQGASVVTAYQQPFVARLAADVILLTQGTHIGAFLPGTLHKLFSQRHGIHRFPGPLDLLLLWVWPVPLLSSKVSPMSPNECYLSVRSIQGDDEQLARVLSNLLDNALKFTPASGSITLSLESTPEGVQVSVTDTGIGIPPEDLPRLFSRFHRGRNAAAYPGNGLGLVIARAIVADHGGQIRVDSSAAGTSVVFTLPREG